MRGREGGARAVIRSGIPSVIPAGIPGRQYIYTHYDGPFGARMIAYVIPWRGKYLAVELRANGDPDAVQVEMVQRFAVDQPAR